MTKQDQLKRAAAEKAVEFVPENEYIGIGTGSTINFFIEALGKSGKKIKGAVTTSKKSSELMAQYEIPEIAANEVSRLSIYIDGADEINHTLQMIKGGGGAHLPEKIVAKLADQFICIADESKYVSRLGKFPLPIEVIPMARSMVARQIAKLGGQPELRIGYKSLHGNDILDVTGLDLSQPLTMERELNQITGLVENGLFAERAADLLILAREDGIELIKPHV
ncbi:ribose-5-phosphate isomerase RpiA [Kingella kingae]|uniref:Ribose-5-phosphate isomerase A n=2 Tax=Kingella kingae TaxID=504 RepID=F5S9T9_KINKI|nr:ribose-5-phosphate isomerase RpiA [Kingella kingae]EGK06919.1 ribose 5-phosphate isomerase A [Kingella kingae ATCC 23330]EIC13064.1 ribose-5-phosphate isomerase A [Kingella kingae PYKK081]MBD3613556.1 ribose-5-phosphate isomerase RpiA [Kingella kingae]MBD3633040.1 ribose-5-phosphate isomerase RpiA [Kingella kingae]MBD3660339.1 ribose-5-phosphate isomerase RpiA [Kingella kingae]